MKVSIVIPNWNGQALLKKNLRSVVQALSNKKNNIAEVIVVDDASTDDSVAYIENYQKKVIIIKLKENKGFSVTVNTGVRAAKSALVCLLNTDVVVEKDFLESIHSQFKKANIFGVSLHEEGYGFAKGKFENGYIVHSPGSQPEKVTDTFWVNGGSGVFRKSVWNELHGLDEELLSPLYWEDVDISYRAAKRGYRLLWDPAAKITHKHEATTSMLPKDYLARIRERNHLLFIWKNLTSPGLIRKHLKGLLARLLTHPGYIKVVVAALGKYKTMKRLRKRELKESKISDEAIFAKFD